MMRSKTRWIGKAVLFLAAIAVLAGVVMQLWNAVVPSAFAGAHSVDYLHALGLLLLSRILFGGFRGHGGWRGRRHWHRLQSLTPDERERVLDKLKARSGAVDCGRDRP